MIGFEELILQLEKRRYKESYRIAERLRSSGIPITTIRSNIYDLFISLEITQARKMIREFKGYNLEGWL